MCVCVCVYVVLLRWRAVKADGEVEIPVEGWKRRNRGGASYVKKGRVRGECKVEDWQDRIVIDARCWCDSR